MNEGVTELLGALAQQGIKLSVEGDQLAIGAPKGVVTPEMRALIGQRKSELVALLRQRSGAGGKPVARITPAPQDRYKPFPLTDIQQAYWIGRSAAFDLGDVSIHAYSEIEATGMDLGRLSRAFQRLVERHEMLRAIVLADGGQQILERVPAYSIEAHDLRGLSPEAAEAELAATRERLAHQLLPADAWPTFEIRASLLDGDRTRIHISLDLLHIDGGSLLKLGHEWALLYRDPGAFLPPIELSFRDYVLAEMELKGSPQHQKAMEYWRERVAVLPPPPELPLAMNPAALPQTRFTRRIARLDPEAWARLKTQALKHGLTLSAVMMTAYTTVLAAWGERPDFTINVTMFNRLPLHPQVNDLLGDFTSLVLLGTSNTAGDTFEERARRVQEQLWNDLQHRSSGIEVLRELAQVRRRLSGGMMPIIFTGILGLASEGFPLSLSLFHELGEVVFSSVQTPQVWLDLQVAEERGGFIAHWDAVAALFPPGMMDDMFNAFCRLVRGLADDPAAWKKDARRLIELPEEQIERWAELNATDAPIPAGTLPERFAAQAAQTPEGVALVSSRRSLTYAELSRLANQIGRWLRERGARPDALVAVVMEKGWEQVAAVLGVHAAGAAYLPVDPSLPRERRDFLLEHGQVELVLTQSWLDGSLEWPERVRKLAVDQIPPDLDASPLAPVNRPEDLAYVLYTSGSTGVPKGAMIEHRSVLNRMLDVNRLLEVGPGDRIIGLTALHHDLSVYDVFGGLLAGATLVLPDAAKLRDPAHWVELLVSERITFWNSVPAFLEMLVEHLEHTPPDAARLPGALRQVVLSGDWIPVTLPDRLRALAPGVQILGAGGPTETTVWDICYPIGSVDPSWKSIPYGRPMTNARYHVLDDAFAPCPEWVPGHLYIAGAGLARGYFHDEERTAASFVRHPETGERLYRSGDLGRRLPGGLIEILGRADFQVKIQGQRIELGEIEAALKQHPAVRSAVAMAVGEERNKKRLVAYVVLDAPPGAGEGAPAEGPAKPEGGIDDPLARLEFKLKQHGLRADGPERRRISLPVPPVDEATRAHFLERRTHRQFSRRPIQLDRFAALLSCLRQIDVDGHPKYRYPSAGSLYPIQTYVYVKPGRVEGVAGGTYYYHPREQSLVTLTEGAVIDRRIHYAHNQGPFEEAAFSLFLVAQRNAILPLYGDASHDFCELEAGYMGQLLMTAAPGLGIGLMPVGKLDFAAVRDLFLLDEGHVYAHALLGGGAVDSSVSGWSDDMQAAPRSPEDALRDLLKAKLPAHMVPASIVVLDAMPLTANGKIDRKALSELKADEPEQSAAVVPPRDETERAIAAVIGEILGLDHVSVEQSFFELGANSIHVVRIGARLREALGRELSTIELFQYPTVRALAARLAGEANEGASLKRGRDRAAARRAARAGRGGMGGGGDE